MDIVSVKRAVWRRFTVSVVVLGAILFGTAGTFRYWEAWTFMAALFGPMMVGGAYLLRHDPGLLERRLQAGEERGRQKAIMALSSTLWMVTFIVPGFDRRFGWSSVPTALVVVADLVVLASYLWMLRVMIENSWASRTIRVEEGQSVVSTGPYAVVRHPMYVGVLLLMAFAPLALGSWWALIPALPTPVFLVLRILDEEEALREELPGYLDYARVTRYRLVPGVW